MKLFKIKKKIDTNDDNLIDYDSEIQGFDEDGNEVKEVNSNEQKNITER